MKNHPAIDVRGDSLDFILASVDGFEPTAAEEREAAVRVFFSTPEARDRACAALSSQYAVQAIDVPDEDWARRSQEHLQPVTVGRIVIVPDAARQAGRAGDSQSTPRTPPPLTVVIHPSMGFGTGHHASTRLCLHALQNLDLRGRFVLDVGTGSGVLAIAAARLGAAEVLGVDCDPDALQSARDNLPLNPAARQVRFEAADVSVDALPTADVVAANLTGALLVRSAPGLLRAVLPGGTLIVSGLLSSERGQVCAAFSSAAIVWEQEEDGWVGVAFRRA